MREAGEVKSCLGNVLFLQETFVLPEDHLENYLKIERDERGEYGLIMSSEIISVLVRSYCRAQRGLQISMLQS